MFQTFIWWVDKILIPYKCPDYILKGTYTNMFQVQELIIFMLCANVLIICPCKCTCTNGRCMFQVRELVKRCTCPDEFPMIRVSEGKYRIGDSQTLIFVRVCNPLLLFTYLLTLKVLNFWKFTSYCSLKPLWSGMGEVVPARTSPTLHPPSPPTVHQLSQLAL